MNKNIFKKSLEATDVKSQGWRDGGAGCMASRRESIIDSTAASLLWQEQRLERMEDACNYKSEIWGSS